MAKKELKDSAQGTHFVFDNTRVFTFNQEIAVSKPFETGISCSIKASDFYSVLEKIKSETIKLNVKNNEMIISGGKTKAGVVISFDDMLVKNIAALGIESLQWTPLPKLFVESLDLCSFSIAKDMVTPWQTGILVSKNKIASTDEWRVSQATVDGELVDMIIPGNSVKELTKFAVEEYATLNGWAHFKTPSGTVFSTRTMKNETVYMEMIDGVFSDLDGHRVTLPAELVDALDTVEVMAAGSDDISKKITVTIANSQIICKGQNEQGWVEHKLEFENKDNLNLTITINPVFFKQMIKIYNSMTICDRKAVLESENFKHAIILTNDA